MIHQDPAGGRHDNDSDDIPKIKIMPTYQEIVCLRREYLPTTDPSEWHLSGIDGLLDRHFRLLREDTVGQLRDAVRPELEALLGTAHASTSKQMRHQGQRTYTYQGVNVSDLLVDKFQGFSFQVSLDQPTAVVKLNTTKRMEWWTRSRRLQKDALICMIDPSGAVIFCSVTSPPRKRGHGQEDDLDSEENRGLYEHADKAFVLLTLISPETEHVKCVLDLVCAGGAQSSLMVEFPGVLVPSFQPTLLALQEMKKSGDLPFSEFLVPLATSASNAIKVPPPPYTLEAGFRFNLKSVMRDGSDLWLSATEPFDIKALQSGSR